MAKKKLGISSFDLNKQFKDRNEAYIYAKRLREYIRYICKKNALNGWSAQAMICISNTRGNTLYQYYEHTGKVGRPRKVKDFSSFNLKYYNGNMNVDWHLHILLVSKPSYAFRDEIKSYIDRKWKDIKESDDMFDNKSTSSKRRVYKKNTNINKVEYFIDQSDDILFCNYNYTNDILIPNDCTLKKLHSAYMRSRTATKYCGKYIKSNNWAEKEKIDNNYNRIKDFYYKITEEKDRNEIDMFMKRARINKIIENKERINNNLQNISRPRVVEYSLF